ncbi:hypothetical protein B0J14DRAFT_20406 [Halenospora varia]|nr:hypothetical protein B0J14DRAFT_20406 [Halenospora varia]
MHHNRTKMRWLEQSACQAREKFALVQYNKSISKLSKVLSEKGEHSELIALVNCLLFVVIDFMSGNKETAMIHLHSGVEILKRWRKERAKAKPPSKDSLEAAINQLFDTMGRQARDRTMKKMIDGDDSSPLSPFNDLSIARRSIEQMAKDSLKLFEKLSPSGHRIKTDEVDPESRTIEDAQRTKLELWAFKFERHVNPLGADLTLDQKKEVASMRVLYLSAVTLLWACENPQQQEILQVFTSLVDIAEELIELCDGHDEDSVGMDVQTISDERVRPAFSIVTSRCSDADVKKRASILLANSSRTAGISTRPTTKQEDGLDEDDIVLKLESD